MFFKFFKRETPLPAAKPEAKSRPRRSAGSGTGAPMLPPEPSTLQVTEGSEQSDWALWEDSVAALDSQLGTLELSRQESQTRADFQDTEAFARVRRKDP